jgi:O-antigen ligase
MKFFNIKLDSVSIAQYLVIGGLVSITISPPLANIFIALSLIATLSITTIRNQLLDFFKTKLGYACITFILIIVSGLIYGIETNNVIASSIWGWRKFLMLPIAAAVFMNAPHAKQNLIDAFWFSCLILMIYSFITYLSPTFSPRHSGGVVVRNYATQGIFFSVAAIIALANTLNFSLSNWHRFFNCASIPFFIFNIALIALGRSGYITLIVMATSFVFIQSRKTHLIRKIILGVSVLFITTGILLNTETSKSRIELAKQEYISGKQNAEHSSIGYRLTFWKNTIEMIPSYGFWGTGAGGFKMAYTHQVYGKKWPESTITGDPHNQYLKILIEHGIFGLVTFFFILALLIKQPATNPFKVIGIASLLGILATSLFNAHFSTFNEGQFIWILSGAMFATEKIGTRTEV